MRTAWEFHVVGPENVPNVLMASVEGDELATQVMIAIGKALKTIPQKAKTEQPMLCMCLDCETKFSTEQLPIAFGITLPMFPTGDKDVAIASGICIKCYERSDLREQVIHSLQKLHGPEATFRDMALQ
jgi:hypothetical protein